MDNERLERIKKLILIISEIGRKHPATICLKDLFPFRYYVDDKGNLKTNELDEIDGLWKRREILTRCLLLYVVLDQGPDLEGVRSLFKDVVNSLYENEIRIFHKPIEFFKELGISIDEIFKKHESIKKIRANSWAKENKSNPNRYNLFTDRTNQVLGYAIYRWGAPLCVPYLLEKDFIRNNKTSFEPLVEYIESWDSAEIMSQQIKDHGRYGLGKAIGDKAGHLFAKLYIHSFKIAKRAERKDKAFGPLSYELPLDSNAGRVLFRCGFLLDCADLSHYENWNVIQKEKGKGGKHYIRVTNIRGKKSDTLSKLKEVMECYKFICSKYLKIKENPLKIEIQHIPNVVLLDTNYGIGDLDDGLIYIGTNYCFNHDELYWNKLLF